jgi:hypothetical protein
MHLLDIGLRVSVLESDFLDGLINHLYNTYFLTLHNVLLHANRRIHVDSLPRKQLPVRKISETYCRAVFELFLMVTVLIFKLRIKLRHHILFVL